MESPSGLDGIFLVSDRDACPTVRLVVVNRAFVLSDDDGVKAATPLISNIAADNLIVSIILYCN